VLMKPAPITPPDVASVLWLSNAPNAKHIGYWRDTFDGSDGYAHRALRSAEKDLASFRSTGKPPYYTGEKIDEAYLSRQVDRRTRKLAAARTLPWPGDHVDPEMPEAERERLATALFEHNSTITYRYASPSWDRLSWPPDAAKPWDCFSWGNGLGSGEVVCLDWVWPEGLFRYVQRYGLVLPREFLDEVLD
jgi:hypothetical protein